MSGVGKVADTVASGLNWTMTGETFGQEEERIEGERIKKKAAEDANILKQKKETEEKQTTAETEAQEDMLSKLAAQESRAEGTGRAGTILTDKKKRKDILGDTLGEADSEKSNLLGL